MMPWLCKYSLIFILYFLLDFSYGSQNYDSCIHPVRDEDYHPICGSDGVTYYNMAQFRCADDYKSDLKIAYYGECRTTKKTQKSGRYNVKRGVKKAVKKAGKVG